MAEDAKPTKEVEEKAKKDEPAKKEEPVKKTPCWVKSRANHIIEVKDGIHTKFIPPFGKIKVIKEQLKLMSDTDASYLTFIKA